MDSLVAAAMTRLEAAHGDLGVGRLAADLDCSRNKLAHRFAESFGVAPKTVARILRFSRARGLARRDRDLAQVAAACGFSDQAHLTREFVDLAGAPPSRWLRNGDGVTFLQDDRPAPD